MKLLKSLIIPLLFLLLFSAGDIDAGNKMKIPLVEGYDNPSFQIENTTVEPVRLYIQDKPYSDSSVTVFLEMKIAENDQQHSTYLNYWEINTSGLKENYPKAFGKHLFSLEVNETKDKAEVSLIVEENDFGKPFFLELNQKTMIDSLFISFDMSVIGRGSRNADEAFHDIGMGWIKLSANGEEETITFDSDELFDKKRLSFDWKEYRMWILAYPETSVQLKVERSCPNPKTAGRFKN